MLRLCDNPTMLPDGIASVADLQGRWWVAHTRARAEKALARDLQGRGIGYFLPMRLFATYSGDRKRQVLKPIFTSYLFLCGNDQDRYVAMTTNHICQTLEVREYPAYAREKFVFESRRGVWVLGYLLTPKTRGPYAAVIAIPGHGRGVDDIVGIDEHGRDRTVKVAYEYDYAIQIVEHGMAAVAIEPMAFGCRRDAITKAKGLTASACQPAGGSALLLGQTILGWRVYDTMRTIDWIATRPELDAARVGCLGCSGGGTCTLFTAALDTRVRAALVSSSLNTFRDSIMSVSHCIDNYVPGILNWAEMYDVAALVAPRALFAEGGLDDDIFPIAATRASFDRVKKVYEMFGAGDRTELEVFDGPHGFWGKRGLPFLARHLGV